MAKTICVHMHIFKNAGTTIDWVLQRNFGNQSLKWDDEGNPRNIFTPEQVLEFVQSHSDAKAISSHQMRFPLPQVEEFTFIPMVFVRHPIDRSFSIYNFSKRDDRKTPYNEKAKSMTAKEFIRYNLDTPELRHMKNSQTAWLSYDARQYDMNGRFPSAIKNLTSCPIMGVVDRLDESMVIAEDILRRHFSDIDLSYIRQNVSSNNIMSLKAKLEARRIEIGDELWKKLERNNKHDLNLYAIANEELDKRISKIDDFGSRLGSFRERCRKLEAQPNKIIEHTDKPKSLFGSMRSYFSKN